MLHLSTIGPVTIDIDGTRVPPANQQVFAALLFLIVERGKPVPRRTLVEMFFPDSVGDSGTHSLRQLLYRLRKVGAEIETDVQSVTVPAGEATWDVDDLLSRAWASEEELKALAKGYLADFAPHHSDRFTEWLDEHRAAVGHRLRTLLVDQLQAERSQRHYRALTSVARACLALDPLNEEATLAAAEALAMSGSKVEALGLLDGYMAEMGAHARKLGLQPRVLRERICDYVIDPDFGEAVPLVGREQELGAILALFDQSAKGSARACTVVGPSGVGKTRLVNEACSLAALSGHAIVRVKLHAHDARRPFAVLRDLCPALLDLPGAIGASPESLATVRGLCGRGPSQFQAVPTGAFETQAVVAEVHARVIELVDAIAGEQPFVICIEDAHWIDDASLELISDVLGGQRAVTIVLATQRALEAPRRASAQLAMAPIALKPLSSDQSVKLLDMLFRRADKAFNLDFISEAARIAGGMPFYLHVLFRNFQQTGDYRAIPEALSDSLIARLEQLGEPARSVFDAIVILGADSTESRLATLTKLPTYALVEALRFLEESGLIRLAQNAVVPAHDLFAHMGFKRMPPTVARMLHRSAATVLEEEPSGAVEPLGVAAHWVACGEDSRALGALTRSASEYMLLGRPREAATLLVQARKLAHAESDKAAVGGALFTAYRVAGEYAQALELARSLGFFQPNADASLRLAATEMMMASGQNVFSEQEFLMAVAKDRRMSVSDRGRAVKLLMVGAEDKNDEPFGREAIEAMADIDADPFGALIPRLMYETVFGDYREAISIATRLYHASLEGEQLDQVLPGLHAAALAFWRNGEVDKALDAASAAYDRACRSRIWGAATSYAALTADIHWMNGRTAAAREWTAKAAAELSKSATSDGGIQHYAMLVLLALDDGDPDKAMQKLLEADRLYPRIRGDRLGLERLAYFIRIEFAAGRQPDQALLRKLVEGHLARRDRGLQDLVADTVVASLKYLGETQRADELRNEYMGLRKDRFAPPPALFHLNPKMATFVPPASHP